ncbi:MAG: sporulation transcriptional regulator SpoIIID [Lachnospiraceae bacterium]|jgi:putative DeoR family transcriptional regulator (stage III sporulation protein D)|nr:sporulation transcriptional regulator SpoIIID [Lachnospiraceae bacterium]
MWKPTISNEKITEMANSFVDGKSTVRRVALIYGVPKSTVHTCITSRLKIFNGPLYKKVRKQLDINKKQRHIRGGQATKRKYLQQ